MMTTAQQSSPASGQVGHAKPLAPLLPRILSGSIGSVIYVLGFNPLEVVKIRTQAAAGGSPERAPGLVKAFHRGRGSVVLSNGLKVPQDAFPCLAAPPAGGDLRARLLRSTPRELLPAARSPGAPGSIIGTFLDILRHEGRAGLYAGLRPTLAATVPNAAVYYAAYDEIAAFLRRSNGAPHHAGAAKSNAFVVPLVAGASARLVASVATAPLELIRVRQVASSSQGSILQEFRSVLRSHGPLALYRGLGPTVLRDVPFSALYFLCFEAFQDRMSRARHHEDRGTRTPARVEALRAFASGAAAGAIAVALTTPFDLVKTRQQAAEGARRSAWSIARRIVREEGPGGLWRGNLVRLIKVAPGHAITISCYELGKRLFEDNV